MKYILTKHAIKRKEHHEPKEKKFLMDWMSFFDNTFNFTSLDDKQTYKIKYKNNVAVIRRESNRIILITFYGFQKNIEIIKNNILIHKENNKRDIYRINFKGREVKCGRIDLDEKKMTLRRNLKKKFVMPEYSSTISFNEIEELSNFISFENKRYWLKEFARIETSVLNS